ncbi:MAG: Lrp/AsnC family transcriptional regulator [Thermoplasmatota archaeon]
MDDLDRRLIALLRRDGRASYTELAQELDRSEGTVRARVKRMQEEGTITGFTVRTKGATGLAIIDVTLQGNSLAGELARALLEWEHVAFVWEVTGETDLVVVASASTLDDLNRTIDKIRSQPGVTGTRSRLVLHEH